MHLVRMVLEYGVPVKTAGAQLRMSRRSASRFLSYFEETGRAVHYNPDTWNRRKDNLQDDEAVK